ncbi:glycerol-3-phosphate dehydrogenase/oxidase [Brevibacillus borstelensis]|uniref:glycerol-3-phosphate dehydrogenase/oxidase n=1 Tax=Brevibacillus borstelensis TaxID=45462 RepID=UPI0004F33D2C|nr:glycerol-3-phosphate dehydrogenase/oxidase [Brevibacillus borstelensis]KKX54158.1 glycerol-3-phosphate dehydrogenase [Brevibacillus borstelensis cifa_chp40]MBE5398191.1 glycerol-3-phosphate dehydrogenase/oxidase [Brevibacillus borstelensis]MED1746207.1 glycerol-3-phosphate dehydrogenase/oxidase [Brevibacillus borstelensis]
MGNRFSARTRQELLQQMSTDTLDLLVIGGGITGAGIALDASKRGLKVGLLEMNDFGSGTSSRSTKLIHGGLRYLKQGEVRLVQEVGRERAILYKNAPHLVIPAPMLLPIYKGGTYGYLASSVGLYVYDWLAGVARKERRKMLGRKETLSREPLLKTEGLKGAGLYFEYRTDDARLTLDIMKTAVGLGATAVNYAKAEQFLYDNGMLKGALVTDRLTGKSYPIHAKYVVNATGPWVDGVRQVDGSLQGKRLYLTKGVHLVVSADRLPVKQAAYFDTPDGRMVFVIPRGRITYIGTTDTAYEHSIDHPRTTEEDRDYLLRAVNSMFPSVRLEPADVHSNWAGLRPLIYEEGKGPSELSRKDEIFHSPTGLITIAGGKLTGFRKMAEKVVDTIAHKLKEKEGKEYPACSTDRIVISGGVHHGYEKYGDWKKEMLRQGIELGVETEIAQEWIDTFGSNTLSIYKRISEGSPTREQLLAAQIKYAIEEEMTVQAVDFLRLRTGWTYFQLHKAEELRELVVRLMAQELGWSAAEAARQNAEAQNYLHSLKNLPRNEQDLSDHVGESIDFSQKSGTIF